MFQIDGKEAFSSTLRNKARKYPDRDDPRWQENLIFPQIQPRFVLSAQDSVFTIGSCFARNVEKVLLQHGLAVPTAHFTAPYEEAPGQPNRILNQYNPGTMLQCIRAIEEAPATAGLYAASDGMVTDCLLATGSRPVTRERAIERRAQIRTLYSEGLTASGFVVVTLGLVEAWYDQQDNTYLNEAPSRKVINKDPGRFVFRQLDVETCRALVFELLQRLTASGNRKVLLTVSPVPLQVTFAGGDATMRNSYSKSVLRVVAEMAIAQFDAVDYFPSYEIITTGGLPCYGEDNVHVRPVIVEKVIGYMAARYLPAAQQGAA